MGKGSGKGGVADTPSASVVSELQNKTMKALQRQNQYLLVSVTAHRKWSQTRREQSEVLVERQQILAKGFRRVGRQTTACRTSKIKLNECEKMAGVRLG